MKKHLAVLAAFIMVVQATTLNTNAQTLTPVKEHYGTPGQSYSPAAINNAGVFVGLQEYNSHAYTYKNNSFIDIGAPTGSGESRSLDVNGNGEITGMHRTGKGDNFRSFFWKDGVFQDLGSLGGKRTYSTSINNNGQVTGRSDKVEMIDGEEWSHGMQAFLWENGSIHAIETPSPTLGSEGYDINSRGQVVGSYRKGGLEDWWNNETAGFLWQEGKSISIPGFEPSAINDKGLIVGTKKDADTSQTSAYIWDNGNYRALGKLSGKESFYNCWPVAINNNNVIVGNCSDPNSYSNRTGFIWENGLMTRLDHYGISVEVVDISDNGNIVGQKTTFDNTRIPVTFRYTRN